MNKLRSPIVWAGGKGNMRKKIIPILESIPHKIYCEPFGGGASILLGKKPVSVEVYNDIDSGLYDFFKVISDPELFKRFYRRVSVLPYHRQLFYDCCDNWKKEKDLIKRVSQWFVIARQSFGGVFYNNSWGLIVTSSRKNKAQMVSNWLTVIEDLPEIHARLQRVQIECRDWEFILDTYDTEDTLFYLDPPYVLSTRQRDLLYIVEMTDEEHKKLIDRVILLKGKVAISGYDNEIYRQLDDAKWQRLEWKTACHLAGRTRTSKLRGEGSALKHVSRTEVLWIKPHKKNSFLWEEEV